MATFMESYRNFMETKSDPRTADWWMMSGPAPLATVLITYVYFSVSAGPKYMRDKKPYDLKYVLIVYNAIQVLLSAFLVYEGLQAGWLREYSFKCQPVDYSNSPNGIRMAGAVWWYFFAKIVELLDTVFFVLRKKNNQITFLHVWHHTLMPVCAWIGVKFLPGGHGTLLGVINSFIHIIMYTYYLLAGLGPEVQKYLWWKKYVTRLQLIQFTIILFHNLQNLPRDCSYPKTMVVLMAINAGVFIYLFGSFYVKTYKKNKSLKAAASKTSNGVANGKIEYKTNECETRSIEQTNEDEKKSIEIPNGKQNGKINEILHSTLNGLETNGNIEKLKYQ